MALLRDIRVAQAAELDLSGDMITIRVGRGKRQKTFITHSTVICPRAPFFEKSMSGSWSETENKTVNLPEDSPETFSRYISLIYTGQAAFFDPDKDEKRVEGRCSDLHNSLVLLYILAEKLLDTKSKELVIETILAVRRKKWSSGTTYSLAPGTVKTIYDGTPNQSPLRKLIVDDYVECGDGAWLKDREDVHPEFLYDLAVATLNRRSKVGAGETVITCDATKYHEKNSETA